MWRSSLAAIAVTLLVSKAHAEPETPIRNDAEERAEDRRALEQEQERLREAKRLERTAAERATREKDLTSMVQAVHDKERKRRAAARGTGYFYFALGTAFTGSAITFGVLGSRINDDLKNGSLTSVTELEERESRGRVYNVAAYGSIGTAALFVGLGVRALIVNRDIGEIYIEPLVTTDTKGISISGGL